MDHYNFTSVLKAFLKLVLLLVLLFIVGCDHYYSDQLITINKDGLIYKLGQDDPFTGRIIDTLKNKIIEYDVVDGMKNGKFRLSYLDGIVSVFGKVKNNRNIGEWIYFYPNGQLESKGNFNYDKPHGKWMWFYSNGNLKESGSFLNGHKSGKWYQYTIDGNLISIKFYDKGDMLNEIKLTIGRSS
ncbi:MAG: hypothetical protein O6940_07065 [Ignavibacteria bacterium]|nr:hypothetical protein [Ignavibacteria bacterium]